MADRLLTGTTLVETKNTGVGQVWCVPGIAFQTANPDTDQVTKNPDTGDITADADGIDLTCPINIPDRAVITNAIIFGNAGAGGETWYLRRGIVGSPGNEETIATEKIGNGDSSITTPTVNNASYYYWFETSLDTNDTIYSVRVTYSI